MEKMTIKMLNLVFLLKMFLYLRIIIEINFCKYINLNLIKMKRGNVSQTVVVFVSYFSLDRKTRPIEIPKIITNSEIDINENLNLTQKKINKIRLIIKIIYI